MFKRTSNPAFSIILPSRKRVKELSDCIFHLHNLAKNKNDIEYCLKIDDDDIETISFIRGLENFLNIKYHIGPREGGYADLYKFFNKCCEISTGDWLFLYNDDARMLTKNWDEIILSIDPWKVAGWQGDEDICLYAPSIKNKNASFIYPILKRETYQLLGHFSIGFYSDDYIFKVMSPINAAIYIESVQIEEVSASMADDVQNEGRTKYKDDCVELVEKSLNDQRKDCQKLKDYMQLKKLKLLK